LLHRFALLLHNSSVWMHRFSTGPVDERSQSRTPLAEGVGALTLAAGAGYAAGRRSRRLE
jgi:hypothetical protein